MAGTTEERFTGLGSWISYRGGPGMVLWALHRAAGVGILLFLALHVVDIFLLGFGEEVFDELLVIYRAPWARVLEVFLLFGVLFHALNGLRIILQDVFPDAMVAHARLVKAELVVFLVIFLPAAWMMLKPLFGGG